MPPTFDDEMNAGFAELSAVAGTATTGVLTYSGQTVAGGGVLAPADVERLHVDTKLGSVRRCRLEVTRAAIAALTAPPKVGGVFELGGKKMRIEDIDDEDITATTLAYIVKISG